MKKLFTMTAFAESGGRSQNGVNGRAENGQSLRRQNGESMGAYLRRVGSSVVGATSRTRGVPARVVTRTRGRG